MVGIKEENKRKTIIAVKDITLIAILTTLLFVQEQALMFIPNVQLTVFLIVLYSKKLGFIRTSLIVLVHTILDNLVMGSFNLLYTPAMLIGWMIIPCVICTVGKKINSNIWLALLGVIFSFTYCWCFIYPSVILLEVDPLAYFTEDILFEVIMALSSFLMILILYNPLSNAFDKMSRRYYPEKDQNK